MFTAVLSAAIACGAVCNQQVAVQQFAANVAITPFAIPVAVPVASVQNPSLFYNYNSYASQYSDNSYGGYAASGAGTAWEDRLAARVAEKVLSRVNSISPASAQTLVASNCVKCHQGEDAKGAYRMDVPLTEGKKLKAITRILADDPAKRMPKGKTLGAEELGKLIQELSRPAVAAESAVHAEVVKPDRAPPTP